MLTFEIQPTKKVGEIVFGMTREEVRNTLNLPFTEFKKTKFSSTLTDNFQFFHVYYDTDNRCEAIEFFQGCTLILDNTIIFPSNIDSVFTKIYGFQKDGDFYTNIEQSVSIFAPNGIIESILLGKAGYYATVEI